MKRTLTLLVMAAMVSRLFAYDAVVDGIYYNLDQTAKTAEVTESGMGYYAGAIVIPASITYQSEEYSVVAIGRKAFRQNSTLTSVSLPESITRIDDFAFAECTALTSISIPSGVDSIGNYAFAHSGITHNIVCGNMFAYLPESYSGTFVVPDTITRICGAAFTTCTGLTGVTLPDGLQYIGYSAFGTCTSLLSVTIPNSVTYIGEYAFNECYSLTSVTLPETLSDILMCTFYSCTSLPKIVIPATVKSVGKFGFCLCSSLADVRCYATTPPTAGQCAFDQLPEEPTLLVPSGCSSAYRRAAEWSTFSPRIYEMGGVKVDDVEGEDISIYGSCGHILVQGAAGQRIAVYSADGKLVSRIQNAAEVETLSIEGDGVYFVRFGNGFTRRVVVK